MIKVLKIIILITKNFVNDECKIDDETHISRLRKIS